MRMRQTLVALAAGIGLVLAGCGDDDTGDSSEQPTFNDADITFAQDMILHHQQAVMMATLATDRAKDTDVKNLADEIQQGQEPEIETMQAWLKEWDAEVAHDDMGHMGPGNMPGMMSEAELNRLNSTSGRAYDRRFLRLMIEHHQGAIEMAQTEQADGENPDALALAEDIETAQTREIDQMTSMLDQ